MNKQQQPISFSKLIEKLRNEYDQLKERVCREKGTSPVEQRLMREQLHMMFGYMDNLRARISYQEEQQLRQMIEQSIPHAPIASVEKSGGDIIIHHCRPGREKCQVGDGSGVVNEVPDSIKSLEGMQVIKVCGPKCKDCPCGDGLREYPSGRDMSSCVKVELVGCYYLCLAPLPNSIVTE